MCVCVQNEGFVVFFQSPKASFDIYIYYTATCFSLLPSLPHPRPFLLPRVRYRGVPSPQPELCLGLPQLRLERLLRPRHEHILLVRPEIARQVRPHR